MKLTAEAHAKINLSLDITSVLPNGYHALNTVMQSVSLADIVTLRTGTPGLMLTCDDPTIPTDARNTAYKAAALFYGAAGRAPEAHITIEKRIPHEAGLGGGSADAAAVLRLINLAYGEPLDDAALAALALQVGADVPFCLFGGTRLCLNVGEVMTPLPPVKAHVVLVKPAAGVSTGQAYRRFDAGERVPRPDNDAFLFWLSSGDVRGAAAYAGNVFETLAPLPDYAGIKALLRQEGAFLTGVSGSGSAVFGLFDDAEAAVRAERAAAGRWAFARAGTTADRGVTILA